MTGRHRGFLAAVAVCTLALGACGKQADTNANTPGNPGSGNPATVVRPEAPDGPPGGSSGRAGSVALPGSSGGDAPVGTTGGGTSDAAGRSQSAQPGMGIGGGLNSGSMGIAGSAPPAGTATSAPMGAGPEPSTAGKGSSNATPSSNVGSR